MFKYAGVLAQFYKKSPVIIYRQIIEVISLEINALP
jgi:hypothetical protein